MSEFDKPTQLNRTVRHAFLVIAGVAVLALAACSTPQLAAVLKDSTPTLSTFGPLRAEVPFCGDYYFTGALQEVAGRLVATFSDGVSEVNKGVGDLLNCGDGLYGYIKMLKNNGKSYIAGILQQY